MRSITVPLCCITSGISCVPVKLPIHCVPPALARRRGIFTSLPEKFHVIVNALSRAGLLSNIAMNGLPPSQYRLRDSMFGDPAALT
ncbi:hypothetical protein [Porphyrobacter sp. MBR-155]|uniref:hypothetical protein n=1 Tax=Porphyrobacter sp. MBR-155 TaxID=3156464 RepID=UPI0033973B9A